MRLHRKCLFVAGLVLLASLAFTTAAEANGHGSSFRGHHGRSSGVRVVIPAPRVVISPRVVIAPSVVAPAPIIIAPRVYTVYYRTCPQDFWHVGGRFTDIGYASSQCGLLQGQGMEACR